ncbi:MAG: hypothetical protein WAK55_18975 [Xanthobacteraceae bacterium]
MKRPRLVGAMPWPARRFALIDRLGDRGMLEDFKKFALKAG